MFLKLLALVACLSSALSATAHDFATGGICYNVLSYTDLTVEVTYHSSGDYYGGSKVIPSTVTYYDRTWTVVAIGDSAFYRANTTHLAMQSLTMPNTITRIGKAAFYLQDELTSLTLSSNLKTIDDYAFYACKGLTSMTIPYGVTTIGNDAFISCSNLTSINIPNSVTSLGVEAFWYCRNLSSVTIGSGITTIPKYAFRECTSLTSITIPNNVTIIGEAAFWGCSALKNVSMGNSVTTIQGYAFEYCHALENLTIGSNVTSIGNYAFYDCPALTEVVIPDKVTTIGKGTFQNCTGMTKFTIGKSVTSIGEYALAFNGTTTMYGQTALRAVDIYSNAVTPPTIQSNTFGTYDSSNTLTNPYKRHSVYVHGPYEQSLYAAATYWSNFNTNIYAQQPYDFYTDGIYYNITSGTTAKVVNKYGSLGAFNDGDFSYSGNVSIPNTAYDNYTAKSYNVTAIGVNAFCESRAVNKNDAGETPRNQGDLKTVSMGSNVTTIEGYAFKDCTGLTQVSIGSNVTSIGNYAFNGCSALTTITIPNSVTTLGQSAFDGCSALMNVTLGSGLNSIGKYAFSGCTVLEFVNCLKTTAPTMTSTAFTTNHYNTAHLIIPNGAQSAYVSTTWGYFINKKTIDAALAESVKLSDDITLTTSGAYPWVIYRNYLDSGGSYICATSSNSGQHSTSSVMTGTATVPANSTGTLTFRFKAWGEGTSSLYDKCIFAVDGVTKFTYGARDYDWETYTVELPAGTHTLTWTYQKDGSVNPTGDYFAVDNVKLVTQVSVVTGDVNGDGSTTIADVTALIDSLLSGVEVPLDAADVNGDGSVTIADVTALIDMLLGS